MPGSLHRDALREVPGFVDVCALGQGDVVGEQLDRRDVQDRGDEGIHARHLDRGPGDPPRALDALAVGDQDDAAAERWQKNP